MIYFTSDLHFHHKKVITYSNRPFRDVEQMNRTLIQNWNDRVAPDDDIYILGDVSLKGCSEVVPVLEQLQGKKYLIKGNHDNFADQSTLPPYLFQGIYPYFELKTENQLYVLFHYPITEWNGFFRGAIHLHGHIHSKRAYNLENRANGLGKFDVGVDANQMAPVSREEIDLFFSSLSLTPNKN